MTDAELHRRGTHALYPGSFDVLTYGHLDVLRRASRMFGKVTMAVAENATKRNAIFTSAERLGMLNDAIADLANVEACCFAGLTVEFARMIGATVIIRGLRAVSDFESELQMAMMNDSLAPEVTTIFLAPSPQFVFLSSTLVKEIARYGSDVSEFVPLAVQARLRSRLKEING
jgi:pantetheine-phosphate adenylyltransferase